MKMRRRKEWKWIEKNNILYLMNDIKEKEMRKICKDYKIYIYLCMNNFRVRIIIFEIIKGRIRIIIFEFMNWRIRIIMKLRMKMNKIL